MSAETREYFDLFGPKGRISAIFSRIAHYLTFQRLDHALRKAEPVPFSDNSRIVLFSDCHRGTNGRSDAFARNEDIFVGALDYYYQRAYTYVEVGDGDELWQNKSFRAVEQAHPRVFQRLRQFYREQRLHLLFGNHDAPGSSQDVPWAKKEGILLHHQDTHVRILVVHGHQADIVSDRLKPISRLVVRYIARYLRALGMIDYEVKEPLIQWDQWTERIRELISPVEARLMMWAQARKQALICGHTHRPMYAPAVHLPYFNTGSCVFPGFITGLEIEKGYIQIVKWIRERTQTPRRVPIGTPVPIRVLT